MACAALCLAFPRAARADGAFPDSEGILLPADRPAAITLVTNFGLLTTEDRGTTWLWACEQQVNSFGLFYQVGATLGGTGAVPPRHRVHTLALRQAIYSDDDTCGWASASGSVVGHDVTDIWVDRALPDRVWAVTATCCDANNKSTYAIYESTDRGTTFDAVKYTAVAGEPMTGVESARTDPETVYATLSGTPATDGGLPSPHVLASTDGGATWLVHDLSGQLGPGVLRLMGVDNRRADTIYLLWTASGNTSIVVSRDGGATATKVLTTPYAWKSFVQLANGTILMAQDMAGVTTLFRSRDDGATFDPLPTTIHVRGLAERGGVVYAATDNFGDDFALQSSTDEGTSWTGLMNYAQVAAIVPCLKTACQDSCAGIVGNGVWSEAVCSADPPATVDAGAGADAAAPDAASDGGSTDAGRRPSSGSGCGCAAAGGGAPVRAGLVVASLTTFACVRRRRRSNRSRSPSIRGQRLLALLVPLVLAGGPRPARACGASTAEGFSACSFTEEAEATRRRWHVSLSTLYTSTSINFLETSGRVDQTRAAAVLAVDFSPSDRTTLHLAAGRLLSGHIDAPPQRFDFAPGRTAAVGLSHRVYGGSAAGAHPGVRPFVVLTANLSASDAWTHERVPPPIAPFIPPPSPEPDARYSAADLRVGALAGITLGRVFSPYLLARAFGGPVWWRYRGEAVSGTDAHHYQLGAGASAVIAGRLGLFVEGVPLGERAAAGGLSLAL